MLLEGLEVVVIVVSFAARGHSLGVRFAAAGLAVLLVTLAGRTAVESTLRVHLEPHFGERGIATVTREHVEDLPTLMEGKIGPKLLLGVDSKRSVSACSCGSSSLREGAGGS